MIELNNNRLKATASKLCLCVLTCGVLGVIPDNNAVAQSKQRLPIIQSLSFGETNQNPNPATPQQAGHVSITPMTGTQPHQQPGKVSFGGTMAEPALLPAVQPSEFKQQQAGRLVIGDTVNDWSSHRDALPPAPPVHQQPATVAIDPPVLMQIQEDGGQQTGMTDSPARFNLPQHAQGNALESMLTRDRGFQEIPVEYEAAPVFDETVNQTFETTVMEHGSGKPGVSAGEENYWVMESFTEPESTPALEKTQIQPTTAVQFQEIVPSQFAQQPAGKISPNFYEEETPFFDEDASETNPRAFNSYAAREMENIAVVRIGLEEMGQPEAAPAPMTKQETSPFMKNLQQTSATVPSVANSMVQQDMMSNPAGTTSQPARRTPRIAAASMLEDWTEERMEDLPPAESVGAWFGYNMYSADNGPAMPEWKFRAEALYWHRSDPQGGDPLLIRVPDMAPPQSFIGNDVDYDNELGQRYHLERMNTDGTGFDMEYFGVNDWSDTIRWVDQQVIVLGTDIGAGSGAFSSDTEFHSWEIDGRREWDPWTTFFGGFRYMNLDEDASISGAGSLQNVFASIDVSNNLYGLQLGLDRTLFDNGGVLTIDMSFNLGLFLNDIDSDTVNFPTGFDNSDSAASLLRELNFNMNLAVTDHVSLVGGYTLLWLDDVALGPDQFRPAANSLDDSSNIFVHGGNLGLQYEW